MTDLAGQDKTFFFDNSGVAADPNAPYTNSGAAAQLTLDQLNADGVVTEIGGAIADGAGALSLALAGVGAFEFNGANAFSGDVDIEGSTLAAVAADGALGSGEILFTAGAGKLEAAANFATAQTIVIDAGVSPTLEAAAGDTLTASGAFDDLGGQGSTLTIGSASDDGTVALAGSASEDALGAFELAGGTLQLGSAGAAALLTALTGGETIDGTLDLDGQSVTLNELQGAGEIVNSGALATLTLTPDFFAFAGAISGAIAVDVAGAGHSTLTGANSYTGGTTIAAGGELDLGNGVTHGSLTGAVVDNGVLEFDEPGSLSFAGALSGSGELEVASGHIALSGDTSGFTGLVLLNRVGLTLNSANAFDNIRGLELDDAATLETTTSLYLTASVSVGESGNDSATLEAAAGTTLALTGKFSAYYENTLHIGSATDSGVVVLANPGGFASGLGFGSADVVEIDGGTLDALASLELAPVVFTGTAGRLILNGGDTTASSAAGASGEVYLNGAEVSFSGGGELVYFVPGTYDHTTLSNTGGLWDAVYGSNGVLTLDDAQVSIVGGDDYLAAATAGSAVSLFDTGGAWDTLYEVNLVYLTDAQAAVFASPASVFLLGADDAVSFYYSNTAWDSVYGSNGAIAATASRVSIVGGADVVYLYGTTQDMASLFNTGGEWDTVVGSNAVLALTNAQASIIGGDDIVYLLGAGDAVSLDNTTGSDTVYGSNGVVILNNAQAAIVGGGNTVSLSGSANLAEISGTNGAWDGVDATNAAVLLDSAQAAIVGYGDTIFMNGDSTVSETLTGNHDAYVYQQAMGLSTISGFTTQDTIALSNADFIDIQDIFNHMSQSGDDSIIRLDVDNQITLTGVQKSSLSASQFSLT